MKTPELQEEKNPWDTKFSVCKTYLKHFLSTRKLGFQTQLQHPQARQWVYLQPSRSQSVVPRPVEAAAVLPGNSETHLLPPHPRPRESNHQSGRVGPASCRYNSLPGDPDACSGWEPGLRPVTQRQWLPHWVTVSSALAFRWLSLIEPTLQVCECLWYRHHPNPYHNASKETTFPPILQMRKQVQGS